MTWQEWTDAIFRECADDELARYAEVAPALAAFSGDELLFVAWLRPFAKGAYDRPVIELCALAVPLGGDRLALSMGARAWSLDKPVPRGQDGVDARQRVLITTYADGAGTDARVWNVVHPFDLDGDRVRWHEPTRLDGGEGWIADALAAFVQTPDAARDARAEEVADQAERVVRLGHELYLSEACVDRLGRLDRGPEPAAMRRRRRHGRL
jgi:hypothetical protein